MDTGKQLAQHTWKSSYVPARNPIIKPGEAITLDELLDRIPQADENLLRDVDAAQRGDDASH